MAGLDPAIHVDARNESGHDGLIRVISARTMHRKERRRHEPESWAPAAIPRRSGRASILGEPRFERLCRLERGRARAAAQSQAVDKVDLAAPAGGRCWNASKSPPTSAMFPTSRRSRPGSRKRPIPANRGFPPIKRNSRSVGRVERSVTRPTLRGRPASGYASLTCPTLSISDNVLYPSNFEFACVLRAQASKSTINTLHAMRALFNI
jgi:hypothetical protein